MTPALEIAESRARLREAVSDARTRGRSVSFVPTMGALHEGHLSLIREAAKGKAFTVVSVFVNPLQFGPGEDYERYPRDLESDAVLAAGAGANLLYVPRAADLYAPHFRTNVSVRDLSEKLCGATRPGHFDGVTTVVLKLLHLVSPDRLFLGQKDAQQAIIIRRMLEDLDMAVRLEVRPTVREPDGLALSSRNAYLTAAERAWAPAIHRALVAGRRLAERGERDAEAVASEIRRGIEGGPGRIDYAAVVDTMRLEPLERLHGEVLLATAVFLGRARLIDNEMFAVEPAAAGSPS
jgi:pantoate--beta-alanine ligase